MRLAEYESGRGQWLAGEDATEHPLGLRHMGSDHTVGHRRKEMGQKHFKFLQNAATFVVSTALCRLYLLATTLLLLLHANSWCLVLGLVW